MLVNKRGMKVAIIFVIAISACFVFGNVSYAANGPRMLGFSSRDAAMAGATTATRCDRRCAVSA